MRSLSYRLILGCLLIFIQAGISVAQSNKDVFKPKQGYLLSIQYGLHFPARDMAKRFGWNSGIGLDAKFKTEKGWMFGGSYHWMFGSRVKEPGKQVFDSFVGSTGEVIDQDGLFSVVRLNERCHILTLEGGKLFPILPNNRNSGILVQAGFGAMYHRIDIYASTAKVPQITGDYEKGYDRLSGGVVFTEYIGYQHLDRKKQINFNIGYVMYQGFTKSLRTTQFDLRRYDDQKREDFLSGLRIGVTLPLYTKRPEEEEFFTD